MEHPHLPWNLTVHFQEYPKDILTRRESPQSLQDLWLNNLKEVPFLPLVHFEHPPSNLSSHLPLFLCTIYCMYSVNPDFHPPQWLRQKDFHPPKHPNHLPLPIPPLPR